MLKRQPAKELYKAAVPHPTVRITNGLTPFERSTLESWPVILRYSPPLVLYKNKKATATAITVKAIEKIRMYRKLKVNAEEVKTPRFLNSIEERQEGIAENNRFNAIPAINLLALKYSINIENNKISTVVVRLDNINPKTGELVPIVNA